MTYERDYVSTQPAPQAGAADLAQPSSGIPTEAGIAWQSGATWPNERKAVTVEGHAWYRHDHPRFAAHPTEQPSQDADQKGERKSKEASLLASPRPRRRSCFAS